MLSCQCLANGDLCSCSIQVLLLPFDDRKEPIWLMEGKTTFPQTFFSSLKKKMVHVAIMDAHVLYVPIIVPISDSVTFGYIATDLRSKAVRTIAHVLATLASHPKANLGTLVVEPCFNSLSCLSFKDAVNILDLARRQLTKDLPSPLSIRLEVRLVTPQKPNLSFCRLHKSAPRVCAVCFFQSTDEQQSSVCPHCYKQRSSFLAPQSKPRFEMCEDSPATPPPPSYASSLKNGLVSEQTPDITPPTQVIVKVAAIEHQLQSHAENFRSIFNEQHALAEKLSTLEQGPWQTHTGKNCASTKRVQTMSTGINTIEIELASLSGRVLQFEASLFQIQSQLKNLASPLPSSSSATSPELASSPPAASGTDVTDKPRADPDIHNVS